MTNPYQPGEPGQPGNGEGTQPTGPAGSSPQPGAPEPPQYGQYGPTGPTPASTPYPAASPYPGQTPYGQQAPYPGGGYQQSYGYPKNSLGVWSLVLGIVGFFVCSFFTGIPAIIVGNRAKKAVAAGEANNGGMATAGVIIGWITTVLGILSVIVLVIVFSTGNWDVVWENYRDNANL